MASTFQKVSTSFTINGTDRDHLRNVRRLCSTSRACRSKLTGTIQNDILKEYVARRHMDFSMRPSMRLIATNSIALRQ